MRDGGGQGGEAQAVVHGEERAEVELAVAVVARDVKVEGRLVEDARDVECSASGVKSVGGDERELLGVVDVVPVHDRGNDIAEEDKPDKDVDNGKARRGQRTAEEGSDSAPVEAKREQSKAFVARAKLVREDRVFPDKARDGDHRKRLEEVGGENVVRKTADEHQKEELKSGVASFRPLFLFMQRPVERCHVTKSMLTLFRGVLANMIENDNYTNKINVPEQ